MQVKYKDYVIDVKKGTKVCELLGKQIEMAELKPMACRFNNEIKRLDMEIEEDGILDLLDYTSKDGKRAYIRGLILGYKPKELPSDNLYELLNQIRRVGNNLNQIARKANALNFIDVPSYKYECARLKKLEDEIKKKLLDRE